MVTPFEVLAEPHRRLILDLLRDGDRPVGELVGALRLSQPAVSKHLRVLRDAGLVEVRAEAQRRHYRLRAAPLAEVDSWLEPYRRYRLGRLDALERHLGAGSPDAGPPEPALVASNVQWGSPDRNILGTRESSSKGVLVDDSPEVVRRI